MHHVHGDVAASLFHRGYVEEWSRRRTTRSTGH